MNAADIEIFVMTYNRSKMLRAALQSILGQTVKDVKTTVIDNASTDDTEDMVKKFQKRYKNLHYFKQPVHTKTLFDNLRVAQDAAQAKYVIFFHDDDIVHPQFIEIVLNLLGKYDNVDLVCTQLNVFRKNSEVKFKKFKTAKYVVFENKSDFISHIYVAFHIDDTSLYFPNTVYKTENIKNLSANYDLGGKCCDKPFVISSLHNGKILQIREPSIFNYRVHPGQDSCNKSVNPNKDQIIGHQTFFLQEMKQNPLSRKCFYAFSPSWLFVLYDFGNNSCDKQDKKNFFKLALKRGVLKKIDFLVKYSHIRFMLKKFVKWRREKVANSALNNKIHKIVLNKKRV